MKRAVTIGIFATFFGSLAFAAESSQAPSSASPSSAVAAGETSTSAMRRAAGANQYLLAVVYDKEIEPTRLVRKNLEAALKKIQPSAQVVAIDRAAESEKEFVDKYGLSRAPMPLVLAIAPNGAVTGGFGAAELTEARLEAVIASPGMQTCVKAMQERKLIFICLQNGKTQANDAAMKGVNEFKADPQYAESTESVKVDPADPREAKLLAQLKADPKAKTASTALLAPPGMIVTKVDGATSKTDLEMALKKAMASCAPGSGCCPPK